MEDKSFREIVEKAWQECSAQGWGAYILKEKLKEVKRKVKEWKVAAVRDLQRKIDATVQQINEYDKKEQSGTLIAKEINHKMELQ
uniref:Uncharacterized protein n=1 Tax=Cajanus cajan TaxID=3821 RepID=A0A151RDI6_CAJCA|nr:hypothetical protein KK1_038056 [Cajanus cajan]